MSTDATANYRASVAGAAEPPPSAAAAFRLAEALRRLGALAVGTAAPDAVLDEAAAAVDAASDRPPSDSDANQLVPGDQVVLPAGDLGNLKLEGVHHTSTPSPSRRPDVPCTYAVRHTTGFAEIGGLVV